MFERSVLAIAAAFALACADDVQARDIGCDVDSDYDLTLSADRVEFSRDDGTPQRIVMQAGRLSVDGQAVALSKADAERVARFERELRALMPEVQGVALEAVDIAFTALSEVARGLSDDSADTIAKLESARAELDARIAEGVTSQGFDEAFVEATVEQLAGELVPVLVGDITAAAISAALTGDESTVAAIEARAERMEKEIEAKVEARADALERRADALCPRIAALDEIDEAFEYRLPGGERLDLLRAD